MNKHREKLIFSKYFVNNCYIKYSKICLLFLLLIILNGCAVVEGMQAAENLDGNSASVSNLPWENGFSPSSTGFATNTAIVAFVKGNLEEAERNVRIALDRDPNDPYALLIGAIVYEQIGRPNRARQHYEDLLILGSAEPSILSGFAIQMPKPIADTARERMKMLELIQGGLILSKNDEGVNQFNILSAPNAPATSPNAPYQGYQQTMPPNAGYPPIIPFNQQAPQTFANQNEQLLGQNIGDMGEQLFTENERNIITRFDIFKKLAEEGLITKEEFYLRRQANIGALLPQTSGPPALGLERPVPTPEMIIDRLKTLRTAFEKRSITAKEHASERSLILDALLPAEPKIRAQTVPPPKDMLSGAQELRKLEVLIRMGLITENEKDTEQKTIERVIKLGISAPDDKPNVKLSDNQEKTKNIAVIGLSPPETVISSFNEKKNFRII